MKRIFSLAVLALFSIVCAYAAQPFQAHTAKVIKTEMLWPKGKMPDAQAHQFAAFKQEVKQEGFNADKCRLPYLQWLAKPAHPNGTCAILISGGGYNNLSDARWIGPWSDSLTARGAQCVVLVYRTPRPEGIPYYQTGWEDGQRAVKLVRSHAAKWGFDPERIGTVSMSAGSHMAVLLGTSSETPAYARIDAVDDTPGHINFAIVHAPAYVTTDGVGKPASRQGYGPDVRLVPEIKFDAHTCPMCLCHGGKDHYSPNGSTLIYRQLRRLGVPAEVHIYPNKPHGVFGFERGLEFLTQMGFLEPLEPEVNLKSRFASDSARVEYIKEDLWAGREMPDRQENQCEPYIEWHIPAHKTTDAIQIIYSGGSYKENKPDGGEVQPARRYLNAKGVTVVTMKYRTPRPTAESGLLKHTTAWEDLQRCIRLVRSEAPSRGLNPDKIGVMGSSAGGHLTLMGVTSSRHQSYNAKDDIDKLPCNVQWGIAIYPAYALTDGAEKHNTTGGNDDSAVLVPEFSFDLDTAPTLFIHGDADKWAAMNSVKCWEKMRAMGIQSELHTLATRPHCFQKAASPGTGSYTYLDRIWEFLQELGLCR